jgi:hypothetical protein
VQFAEAACRGCGAPLTVQALAPRKAWTPPVVHPLGAIWRSPRAAIRSLVEHDPTRGVIILAWLAGFGWFLTTLAAKADDRFPFPFAAAMAVVVGPLLNFGLVFVAALLTTGTGRALGGGGTFVHLRAALAWAQAPMLLFLVLWIPRAFAPGRWSTPLDVLELAVLLWSETLAVVLVAEVHGFSIPRGILAIVLAWAIKLALIVGLMLAVVPDLPSPKPEATPSASASPARPG